MVPREPVQVLRLIAPRCAETFGVGACEATGTPCFNTDATCSFRAALDLSESFVWDFVPDAAHPWNREAGAFQPSLAIPSLRGYRVAPTVLNVAAGASGLSPVGQRSVLSARLTDHRWNDLGDDPYPDGRASDPMTRGTFWSRWIARHPLHVGYRVELYEGWRGDALEDMTRRVWLLESLSRDAAGVSLVAVDPLSAISAGGLTVPRPSPGELATDIGPQATSLLVAGAAAAEYDAAGLVRIGAEVIGYAGRVQTGAGLVFSGLQRGALDTAPAAHDRFERVQRVAAFDGLRVDAACAQMMFDEAGLSADLRDAGEWADEADTWRGDYVFRFWLTEPVDLRAALATLLAQGLVDVWWDERAAKLRFRAQRPTENVPLLTEDGDMLAGSVSLEEVPEDMVTRVTVFYRPRSWVAGLTEPANFARAVTWIASQREAQLGGVRERVIFAPGVQTAALAGTLAATVSARYRDVPARVRFDLAREDAAWTGDVVDIEHALFTAPDGTPRRRRFVIVSAEAAVDAGRWRLEAQNADIVGRLWAWVDDAAPDFDAATEAARASIGFWTDDDGNLPDGTPSQFGWL